MGPVPGEFLVQYPLLPNMLKYEFVRVYRYTSNSVCQYDVMMLLERKVMASSRKQRFTLIEMAKMMPNFVYISSLGHNSE